MKWPILTLTLLIFKRTALSCFSKSGLKIVGIRAISALNVLRHISIWVLAFLTSSFLRKRSLAPWGSWYSSYNRSKSVRSRSFIRSKNNDFGYGILNSSFSMLKLLSDSLKIFCLSKNFVNFRIVIDVEFLGFGTSDEKWSTEGNTDLVVNIVEPAQVILSGPCQTDFTQLFFGFTKYIMAVK